MSEYIKCILDSNRGIYIPKNFVDEFDLSKFEGIDDKDIEDCKPGPFESEWYWDAWINILDNATYTDEDGIEWSLHHDGDLFLISPPNMTDEEYENFFGEPRN